MKRSVIINSYECLKELPNYGDYSYVINKIKVFLNDTLKRTFQMYMEEGERPEIWDVLSEDILNNSTEVQCLAHVYDCVESNVIHSEDKGSERKFYIKPNIENSIFYYKKYNVALVKIIIFQNHSYFTHSFIFAETDKCVLDFFDYIIKRQREYLLNYVTVFTDKEDEVQRKKEHIRDMVNRDDVLMEEKTKVNIYRSIDEFFSKSSEFFKSFNILYKRGILLYGKPGNGKTTLVKSIAGSISAPVVYWQITEYTSSYSIAEVFQMARSIAPMVLVIEDIDSMPESVRSVFLNILDGVMSKEGIFLIGTTNYPEKIDSALINRAGRFDRAYEIKLPTSDLRYRYLLKKGFNKLVDETQLDIMVRETETFSFAQLNELYTSAALQSHYEGKVDIESLLKDLTADNVKGSKNNWFSNSSRQNLGFAR